MKRSAVEPDADCVRLTRREVELLRLICCGLPYKQIAAILALTTGTVKLYAHQLARHIGVSGRPEMTAWALQHPNALGVIAQEERSSVPIKKRLHAPGCLCDAIYCSAMRMGTRGHLDLAA